MIRYLIIILLIFSFCKDPIYQKCDKFCLEVDKCFEDQFKDIPLDLSKMKNKLYINCFDSCMIYNQEIFECYHLLKNSQTNKNECQKIVECTMPIFFEQ